MPRRWKSTAGRALIGTGWGRPDTFTLATALAEMANNSGAGWHDHQRAVAVGQQRLLDLHQRGEVLDDNLYITPGKFGGGGAGTTWLVGSAADVARSLRQYRALGISHFVLSDTPYLSEIKRQGSQLLPLLRGPARFDADLQETRKTGVAQEHT